MSRQSGKIFCDSLLPAMISISPTPQPASTTILQKENQELEEKKKIMTDEAMTKNRLLFFDKIRSRRKGATPQKFGIFGLAQDIIPYDFIREVPELTRSSCIFVKDSGKESVLV